MRSRFLIGVFIALAGLAAGALFWNRAFPTAALQFKITEPDAQKNSRQFLKQLGYDMAGYVGATEFGEDSEMKNYIEKEYGLRVMETKVSAGINLWYWTTRFFKPEQEEEFSVFYDPQGRLVGITHRIPEAEASPRLTRAQARVVAENFLKHNVPHHPFAKLKLVEDSSLQRPHRIDYYFTWEQDDLRLGAAPYQIYVTVQGNRVGSFNECVKVPEAWTRQFNTQRSLNELFETFASYAELPIELAMMVFFVIYAMHHRLRWKDAVPARWLLLFALVEIASTLNDAQDILSGYSTTKRWSTFLFGQISDHTLAIIAGTLGMYLLSLVADAIYRDMLPGKLPFAKAMGRGSLRQPETVRALGVGIVIACFGVGYVSTFYVIANHFGAWSPVDIDYSKILGGPIPWISGMQVGIGAAWREEFTFRVVGILLYWKLLPKRLRWLGIVLAGTTWAFLHSNYPQMPGYLRGCELTVEGVLWGALMVRYGIVATLTGHYLYDCWLSSFVIFLSSDPLHKLGALAVSFWPVALWLIGMRLQRLGLHASEYVPEEGVHVPVATPVHEPTPAWNFKPISLPRRQQLVCLMLSTLVMIVLWKVEGPDDPLNDYGDITLSRAEIGQKADDVLRDHGQDPAKYHRTISLSSSSISYDYLLKFKSPDDVAELYDTEWPDLVWNVRYFRFLQREEFSLTLDKDGYLVNWEHEIPREAQGPSLTKAQALAIASKYLQEYYDFDPHEEKLIADDLVQQEHRRDYSFTWERKDWNWGESRLRTSIDVQGNEPVSFQHYIKVPDEWYRSEAKKRNGWKDAILAQISRWSSFALGVAMVIAFVIMVRRRVIPWKAGFLLAFIPTTLDLLNKLNDLPWFYDGYDTTTPVSHFIWESLTGDAKDLFISWAKSGFQLSVALGLMAWAFGWHFNMLRLPRFDWKTLRRSFPHFAIVLILSLSLLSITSWFREWVVYYTTDKPSLWISYPSINYAVPWLASIIDAVQGGYDKLFSYAFWVPIAVIIYRRYPWLVWTILLLYPFYTASHSTTLHKYILNVALGEFDWMFKAFLIWRLWRFDASMIFLVVALPSLLDEIYMFHDRGGPAYSGQAWPLLFAAILLTVLAWWLRPEPDALPDEGNENAKPLSVPQFST